MLHFFFDYSYADALPSQNQTSARNFIEHILNKISKRVKVLLRKISNDDNLWLQFKGRIETSLNFKMYMVVELK